MRRGPSLSHLWPPLWPFACRAPKVVNRKPEDMYEGQLEDEARARREQVERDAAREMELAELSLSAAVAQVYLLYPSSSSSSSSSSPLSFFFFQQIK